MPALQPFSGIRILDFSWYGAGPLTTRFFALYGAQVVKIESRARLDAVRWVPPFAGGTPGYSLPAATEVTDPNLSSPFSNFNANKLSMELNLGHPQGRAIARRLVAASDVVIDNFAPRVMEEWQLTYGDLVKVKPDIIVVRMPMIGNAGPLREYVGLGASLAAMCGLDHLTGLPEDPPLGLGTNYPDMTSNPCHATIAVLAALRHRRRTGEGQQIEIAQMESTVQLVGVALMDRSVNGRDQQRRGNTHERACPHGAYRCAGDDRWCVISVGADDDWRRLCTVIGRTDLADDPRLATFAGRRAHEAEIDRIVNDWTASRAAEVVMKTLQAVGVAAGIVQTGEDLLDNDPHLAARKHWVYLDHPAAGRLAHTGETFKLSSAPADLRAPGPRLGEHTAEVCRDWLGMTLAEVEALRQQQVLY